MNFVYRKRTTVGAYSGFVGRYLERQEKDFVIEGSVFVKYNGSDGTVIVPYGITDISENAFVGCNKVGSIVLPETVGKIGDRAFSGCYSLKSVYVNNSNVLFGTDIFDGCREVTVFGHKMSNAEKYVANTTIQFKEL